MKKNQFHDELKGSMNQFVHLIYDATKQFPKEEQFGLTSQIRRSALSVALNYVEGYARFRKPLLKSFLEISYGSLKETNYLIHFSYRRRYISEEEYKKGLVLADKIGKMLWGVINKL